MRIVFMGTPDFAVASLDAICQSRHEVVGVVTVPDRQTGRGLKVTYSPVKEYALAHNLPILQPEKLRDEAFQTELRSLNADLFVVVAFRMLPKDVWSMPPMGTFNLHASLLPKYRGAAPINWAIINGETETGITTFLLNEKIDEGAILLQERIPINADDTAETIHDRLAEMGRTLVVKTIEGLADGTLKGTPQGECVDKPSPAPKIFKADCAINWNKNGQDIVNFVRGLSPYPAATMQMTDEKGVLQQLKVYETSFEPDTDSTIKHPTKHIISDKKNYLKISVSDGFVKILSLQMSGKRRISIEEFLRGYDATNWEITN